MLKSNLVSSIHKKYPSLNPNEIESISNLFFKKIILALQEGKKIEIRGFGSYKIIKRKARIGRNPKNSQLVQIPEKKTIKWKTSKNHRNNDIPCATTSGYML